MIPATIQASLQTTIKVRIVTPQLDAVQNNVDQRPIPVSMTSVSIVFGWCNDQVCRQRMSCFYVACLFLVNPDQYVHDDLQMVKIGKRFIFISDVPTKRDGSTAYRQLSVRRRYVHGKTVNRGAVVMCIVNRGAVVVVHCESGCSCRGTL